MRKCSKYFVHPKGYEAPKFRGVREMRTLIRKLDLDEIEFWVYHTEIMGEY